MTPGPRDTSMLKHMLNGRINGGGHYRPDMTPRGDLHHSPPCDVSIGGTLPGPLSVRINGVPGGRLSNMSPHMGSGGSGSVSPGNSGTTGTSQTTRTTPLDQSRDQSSHITDLSHLSHLSHLSPIPPGDLSRLTPKHSPSQGMLLPKWVSFTRNRGFANGKGSLTTLGLLCLNSMLFAILALMFLLELDLRDDLGRARYQSMDSTVREVTLALAALALALNLCCLLVCSAQFIFALKFMKTEGSEESLNHYLQKLSWSRIFAIGSFFISIPIFLTGIILYTFSQFQRTSAIITAVVIGIGIILCGLFMIHNVFVWQKEKSKAVGRQNLERCTNTRPTLHDIHSSPLPNATLDLSRASHAHELSTLV